MWEHDFTRRFGRTRAPYQKGIHLASQVLPRIVAASYRYQTSRPRAAGRR